MYLLFKVKQIFDDSEQRYGADKIRAVLAENGLRISAKRVLSIMHELGLYSIRTDAKKLYKTQQQRKKQNLLNHEFNADHPNQIWVSDITYFRIKDFWMYLCAIIDLFSRRVVGYRISRTASTRLVTTTFRDAYAKRGNPKNLTFHSDRGGQYISDALSKLLQQFGVKQSFSATALMTMLLQKRFSQHLRRKKPIGGNIHLKSTSVKVWMSIFAFTMKSGHIKP